jgi:hypothetical protein
LQNATLLGKLFGGSGNTTIPDDEDGHSSLFFSIGVGVVKDAVSKTHQPHQQLKALESKDNQIYLRAKTTSSLVAWTAVLRDHLEHTRANRITLPTSNATKLKLLSLLDEQGEVYRTEFEMDEQATNAGPEAGDGSGGNVHRNLLEWERSRTKQGRVRARADVAAAKALAAAHRQTAARVATEGIATAPQVAAAHAQLEATDALVASAEIAISTKAAAVALLARTVGGTVLQQGWIEKRGVKFTVFQRRWCVAYDSSGDWRLDLFAVRPGDASHTRSKPVLTIYPGLGYMVSGEGRGAAGKWEIVLSSGRSGFNNHSLCVDSEDEYNTWLDTLNSCTRKGMQEAASRANAQGNGAAIAAVNKKLRAIKMTARVRGMLGGHPLLSILFGKVTTFTRPMRALIYLVSTLTIMFVQTFLFGFPESSKAQNWGAIWSEDNTFDVSQLIGCYIFSFMIAILAFPAATIVNRLLCELSIQNSQRTVFIRKIASQMAAAEARAGQKGVDPCLPVYEDVSVSFVDETIRSVVGIRLERMRLERQLTEATVVLERVHECGETAILRLFSALDRQQPDGGAMSQFNGSSHQQRPQYSSHVAPTVRYIAALLLKLEEVEKRQIIAFDAAQAQSTDSAKVLKKKLEALKKRLQLHVNIEALSATDRACYLNEHLVEEQFVFKKHDLRRKTSTGLQLRGRLRRLVYRRVIMSELPKVAKPWAQFSPQLVRIIAFAILWSMWCTFYVFKWGIYQGWSTTNDWLLSFVTAWTTDIGNQIGLRPCLVNIINCISVGICIRFTVMGSVRQQTRHAKHIASLNRSMGRSTRTAGQQPNSKDEKSDNTVHGSVDKHGSVLITMPPLSELERAAIQSGGGGGVVARERKTKLAKVLPKRTKARFRAEV